MTVYLGDIVGFATFSATVLVILSIPATTDGLFNRVTKWSIISAFGIYVVVTVENILSAMGASTLLLGEVEAYIEILFPVLVLLALYSTYSSQQMEDLRRTQRAMQASQALSAEMIDRAPGGILLLDAGGCVAFANESARASLGLNEDPETGQIDVGGWTVFCGGGAGRPDMSQLLEYDCGPPVLCEFTWPSRDRMQLELSVRRMGTSSQGKPTSYVATFQNPKRAG